MLSISTGRTVAHITTAGGPQEDNSPSRRLRFTMPDARPGMRSGGLREHARMPCYFSPGGQQAALDSIVRAAGKATLMTQRCHAGAALQLQSF